MDFLDAQTLRNKFLLLRSHSDYGGLWKQSKLGQGSMKNNWIHEYNFNPGLGKDQVLNTLGCAEHKSAEGMALSSFKKSQELTQGSEVAAGIKES